jgi:hypothetical protein
MLRQRASSSRPTSSPLTRPSARAAARDTPSGSPGSSSVSSRPEQRRGREAQQENGVLALGGVLRGIRRDGGGALQGGG